MGIEGWQLNLATSTYKTPSVCSSCLGPRETEVKAVVSEKAGNIRTTLTMEFPYCTPCAKRAEREKSWTGLVMLAACVLGGALALGAWVEDRALHPAIGFPAAILVAAALAAGLAFATRPGAPPAPATARGQAVSILRSTDGAVLCTNQTFAERLAEANGASVTRATMWFTTEAWAPLAAMLIGALVLVLWWRYAPPLPATPPPQPAAASPQAPRKPAPPPARPAKAPGH